MAGCAIATDGLTQRFGDLVAVDHVDLSVARGEIFGLIGPDGAGKTTCLRMLAGVMPPSEGTARVAGCDVVADAEGVKQRIGYLSQAFSLYADLTIEENIDFVARLYGEPRERAGQAKEELLEITGLTPFRGRQAGRLSGGMKQKLGLLCALIHRPEVLLLDEPTTGVDPVSRRDFWRILARLPAEGVTVLLSSPYMDEAARCHRLALMRGGRLLAVGTADELAQRVEGAVVEVVTGSVRAAAAALRERPRVLALTPFGDSLHVRLRADDPRGAVAAALDEAGVAYRSVEPTAPTLEDAFLDLVGREEP